MRTLSLVFLTAVAAFPAAAAEDRPAIIAASREVDRQITYFQELYGEDTDLAQIGGIFGQTTDLQAALIDFRMKVNSKAAAEDVAIAFDVVDSQVSSILSEVAALSQRDTALRMLCRRLAAAESDLHYAVFVVSVTPARQLAAINRQASTQLIFLGCLKNNVNSLFAGKDALAGWKDDLAAVQKALATLQDLATKKASVKDLNEQVMRADKLWDKIVQRYESAKQNKAALQGFVSMIDQRFAKLSQVVGIKDRRAPID